MSIMYIGRKVHTCLLWILVISFVLNMFNIMINETKMSMFVM